MSRRSIYLPKSHTLLAWMRNSSRTRQGEAFELCIHGQDGPSDLWQGLRHLPHEHWTLQEQLMKGLNTVHGGALRPSVLARMARNAR